MTAKKPPRDRLFRGLFRLGAAALTALAAVGGPGACSAPFDPPSYINSLRILAVSADKPWARPGDTVRFTMDIVDARDTDTFTPTTIVWLGGCFNPPGQQYYGCYEPLGEIFADLEGEGFPDSEYIGIGPTFDLVIPDDIVASQPDPEVGEKYGLAYVFYLACAGQIRPTIQEGDTSAGFFPLGCFDEDGNELGADAFVPGYTQIYVFDDEAWTNENPVVNSFVYDGEPIEENAGVTATVCPVQLEERRKSGCAATDEFVECEVHTIDIDVPDDIAEQELEAVDADGNPLHEVVWVSYFATGGTFAGEVRLVSDASLGILDDTSVSWVAPEEVGTYQIWAVTRDNRGGSTVVSQFVTVTE